MFGKEFIKRYKTLSAVVVILALGLILYDALFTVLLRVNVWQRIHKKI